MDHIYVNKIFPYACGILDIEITDHLPTYLHIDLDPGTYDDKIKIQFRLKNDENRILFSNLLNNFNWNLLPRHDANIFAETFIETLNNLYSENVLKCLFNENQALIINI